MNRIHRITHPVLGTVSWRELQNAVKTANSAAGCRLCVWCHQPVPRGCRTRCGKSECDDMIWQCWSWGRCSALCIQRDKICAECKQRRSQEADHIVPVSLGGTGDQSNLRGLCHGCHNKATAVLRRFKRRYKAGMHLPEEDQMVLFG